MTDDETFTLYLPLETITGLSASEFVVRVEAEKTFWDNVTKKIDMEIVRQGSMVGMPAGPEASEFVRATRFWEDFFQNRPDAPTAIQISEHLENTNSIIPPSSSTPVARAVIGSLAQEKQTARAFDMLYGTALVEVVLLFRPVCSLVKVDQGFMSGC